MQRPDKKKRSIVGMIIDILTSVNDSPMTDTRIHEKSLRKKGKKNAK